MFPNVMQADQAMAERVREDVALLKRAINLADGLIGMSGNAAYKQFVAAVEDIKGAKYAKMLAAKTDREASLLIGGCQTLDDILQLMTGTQNNRARLAAALKTKEDRLAKLTHPETQEFLE